MGVSERKVFHIMAEEAPSPELSTTQIWCGILPNGTTDDKLREAFSGFGEITDVLLPRKGSRFGFVTFADAATATKALEGMNGKVLPGDDSGSELSLNMAQVKQKKDRKDRKQKKDKKKSKKAEEKGKTEAKPADEGKKKKREGPREQNFDSSVAHLARYDAELNAKCHLYG